MRRNADIWECWVAFKRNCNGFIGSHRRCGHIQDGSTVWDAWYERDSAVRVKLCRAHSQYRWRCTRNQLPNEKHVSHRCLERTLIGYFVYRFARQACDFRYSIRRVNPGLGQTVELLHIKVLADFSLQSHEDSDYDHRPKTKRTSKR
jgi:hypothetical protein